MAKELVQKYAALLFILALLNLCVSCGHMSGNIGLGPPEREIEKSYRPAAEMYDKLVGGRLKNYQQNWERVIQQFSKIVKDHPMSCFADDAQYKLGSCYIQAHGIIDDSPQKAIKAFEHLIKCYPDSEFADDAHYWKAHAYFLKEDYERAVSEYEEFAAKYPQSELRKEALSQIAAYRGKAGDEEKRQVEDVKPSKDHQPTTPPIVVEKQDNPPVMEQAQYESEKIASKPIKAKKTEEIAVAERKAIPVKPSVGEGQAKTCSLVNIRSHSAPEYTRVVLDLSGPSKYESGVLENPYRIYVDVQEANITCVKMTTEINDKFVKNIRASQFDENTVRVVLDMDENPGCNIFSLAEPDRIVIDVCAADAQSLMPSETESEPDEPDPVTLVKQLGLKVKTIVIDPGHGGKDPGAVARSGLQEKDVVLDIAKRLKSLLESRTSYQIYMTRETDIYIPLKERTNFANKKGADIFISIHINAWTEPTARGIETYYLSLASDEEARMTAALENASAERTIKDLNNIVRYILRGAKVKESRELARTIQSQLCQATGTDDRGIKRAPFVVLIGAQAPSILVELGFISNLKNEQRLRTEEYKAKLAQALMEAVERYVKVIDQAS